MLSSENISSHYPAASTWSIIFSQNLASPPQLARLSVLSPILFKLTPPLPRSAILKLLPQLRAKFIQSRNVIRSCCIALECEVFMFIASLRTHSNARYISAWAPLPVRCLPASHVHPDIRTCGELSTYDLVEHSFQFQIAAPKVSRVHPAQHQSQHRCSVAYSSFHRPKARQPLSSDVSVRSTVARDPEGFPTPPLVCSGALKHAPPRSHHDRSCSSKQ